MAQHRQVVLEVVDGVFGALGRRPCEASIGCFRSFELELLMVGDAAGHGTHDFEPVERRDPRTGLRRLDARERDIQPFGRHADREAQQQPFMLSPIVLQG